METINNMLIELYATMAQAEIEKKEKRQKEGIEAKKVRCEWDDYGRPALITVEEFAKEYQKVVSVAEPEFLYEADAFEAYQQSGKAETMVVSEVKKPEVKGKSR